MNNLLKSMIISIGLLLLGLLLYILFKMIYDWSAEVSFGIFMFCILTGRVYLTLSMIDGAGTL